MNKKILLLKGYYGINIHGDSQGDLGSTVYNEYVNPDLIFIMAATIATQGFGKENVCTIDANAEEILPDELFDKLNPSYEYVFLKASAPTIQLDLEMAMRLKKKYPKCKLFIAGHVVKLIKKWILQKENGIDEVIEIPLDFYMYKLVNNTEEVLIDQFPSPDYELFPYQRFVDSGKLRLCIQTSRGCIMGCKYCPYGSFYKNHIYFRNIEKVIIDIRNVLKLNPQIIVFRDQYFTADRNRIEQLCNRIIEEKLKFKWVCETRLDNLDKDLIDLMVKAGLSMICFGVESGNQYILDGYNRRNIEYEQIKEIVRYLNSRVLTLAFYIIGFPEDNWNTVMKTFKVALEINSKIAQFSPFEPCVINEVDLSPDSFDMYKNTMESSCKSFLSSGEIEYIIDSFNKIYNYNEDELENNYKNEYVKKLNHIKLIEKLKSFGVDLDKISDFIRNEKKKGEKIK